MSKASQREASQKQAEYMQRHNITRTTGACPWGCGASIPNGGSALIHHLSRCTGKR